MLADLFTQQQIPRWADEGMAVLAEPLNEQISRTAELTGPLKEGRVFKLSELMAIDYPSAESWSLYYAQSVSLTQFLVEQGTHEQFVRFVRGAQQKGVEESLRSVYKIASFSELENRWQAFARRQAGETTASRPRGRLRYRAYPATVVHQAEIAPENAGEQARPALYIGVARGPTVVWLWLCLRRKPGERNGGGTRLFLP